MGVIFKKRNTWYIDYYDPSGKRVRQAVSRYKETAVLALKKIEVEIAEGKFLDVKRSKEISFKDFAEKFRRKHLRRRNRSHRKQEFLLDGLVRHFGATLMHEITVQQMDAYLEQRQANRAASTVNRDLAMLKSMFSRANEWGDLVDYNPTKGIKMLEEQNERCRYLSAEEQERLLGECSGVLRLVVLVALKTGLRWGEIVNLKWKQASRSNYVDFEQNTIFIHESSSQILCEFPSFFPIISSLKGFSCIIMVSSSPA